LSLNLIICVFILLSLVLPDPGHLESHCANEIVLVIAVPNQGEYDDCEYYMEAPAIEGPEGGCYCRMDPVVDRDMWGHHSTFGHMT